MSFMIQFYSSKIYFCKENLHIVRYCKVRLLIWIFGRGKGIWTMVRALLCICSKGLESRGTPPSKFPNFNPMILKVIKRGLDKGFVVSGGEIHGYQE